MRFANRIKLFLENECKILEVGVNEFVKETKSTLSKSELRARDKVIAKVLLQFSFINFSMDDSMDMIWMIF